jgi:hypothetical protein
MWRVDEDGKMMLSDGEPRPSKPIPMKNLEDILKYIYQAKYKLDEFEDIKCWWIMLASLRELDIVLDTCLYRLGRPPSR